MQTIILTLVTWAHAKSYSTGYGSPGEHPGIQPHSAGCYVKYVTVSVVKQVPSYSKHCTKVDDTKCKTIFKNAFTTKIETQCTPTFDTSCNAVLQTAYKQSCKVIRDIECRIVNLEQYGKHTQKKICQEVPTEKCVPVPIKVEGQKCVNVPSQSCANVPVIASVPVPKKQCYKKPRKVCQTLVTTKPKIVTQQIPKTVCEHQAHSLPLQHQTKKKQAKQTHQKKITTKAKKTKSRNIFDIPKTSTSLFPDSVESESENYPILEAAPDYYSVPKYSEYHQNNYKKEDIPIYEKPQQSYNDELSNNLDNEFLEEDYEPEETDLNPQEDFEFQNIKENTYDYENYKFNADLQSKNLHNYFQSTPEYQPKQQSYFPQQFMENHQLYNGKTTNTRKNSKANESFLNFSESFKSDTDFMERPDAFQPRDIYTDFREDPLKPEESRVKYMLHETLPFAEALVLEENIENAKLDDNSEELENAIDLDP